MSCRTIDAVSQYKTVTDAPSTLTELPTAKQLVESGEKYREEGDNLKALDCFNNAIRAEPSYALAYTYRGLLYTRTKAYSKAIEDFEKAITLIAHPNPADSMDMMPYVLYGYCHYELNNYEQAISGFSKAIEINPYYADGYNFQGLAYFKLGQYQKALEKYTIAIHFATVIKGPQDAYYFNRGRTYGILGEYEKAIDDYTKSIEFNSETIEVYLERGTVYNLLEQYDKALDDFTHVLIVKPDCMSAYLGCGAVYYNLRRYEDSVMAFTKAETIVPSVYAYAGRGTAFIYLKKRESRAYKKNFHFSSEFLNIIIHLLMFPDLTVL